MGFLPSTYITKLLSRANLPPLVIWLNYLTMRSAILLIFLNSDYGIHLLLDLDLRYTNRLGPQYIPLFVSDYLLYNLELCSAENSYDILITRVHISKPTNDK
jgi:hypothetical protein